VLQQQIKYELKEHVKLFHEVCNVAIGHKNLSNFCFFQELKQVVIVPDCKSNLEKLSLHIFNTTNKQDIAHLLGYSIKQFNTRLQKLVVCGSLKKYKNKRNQTEYRLVSHSRVNDNLNFKRFTKKKDVGNERKNVHRYVEIQYHNGVDLLKSYLYKLLQQQSARMEHKDSLVCGTNSTTQWTTIDISMKRIAEHLNLSPMTVHNLINEMSTQPKGLKRTKNIIHVGFFSAGDEELNFYLNTANKFNNNKYHYDLTTNELEVRNCNSYKVHKWEIPTFWKSGIKPVKAKPVNPKNTSSHTEICTMPTTTGIDKFNRMLNSEVNRTALFLAGLISWDKSKRNIDGTFPKISVKEFNKIIMGILKTKELSEAFIPKFRNYLLVKNELKCYWPTRENYTLSRFHLVDAEHGNFDKVKKHLFIPDHVYDPTLMDIPLI
jgi:hypothetical protein